MPQRVKVTKNLGDASPAKTLRVNRSTSSTFQTLYSNNIEIAVSYFDVKVLFGEIASISEESLSVVDRVAVYLSPEHAASFHKLLGRQLETYRSRFGEIRPEPGNPDGSSGEQ